MGPVTRLGISNPRVVVGLFVAVFGLLAAIGFKVEDRLHRTDVQVSGTPASREGELAAERFGDASSLVLLLRGPRKQLDRHGPRIAAAVDREESVSVLTPWTAAGSGDILRPRPDRAIVLIRVTKDFESVSKESVAAIRARLDEVVRPPLSAHLTGYADVAAGIHRSSTESLQRAELIAGPLLILILLLVFRSPVAAAVPLAFGMATIGAARGVISLVNDLVYALDGLALNLASMFALALAVDYSLLTVSRFRRELQDGRSTNDAATVAAQTAGRTIRFAGVALAATMVVGYLFAPGNIIASSSIGALCAVGLSVIAATALPAVLVMLGPRVNRFDFRRRRRSEGRWGAFAWRAIGRPGTAAALVFCLMLLLSLPSLGVATSAPSVGTLPASSPERRDAEAIRDALGNGWGVPYEVLIVSRKGPVTGPRQLAAISRWADALAREPEVEAVLSPAPIERRLRPLRGVARTLDEAGAEMERGRRGGARLGDGLARASRGVDELETGLQEAAEGAGALHLGSGRAADGSEAVADGIARARAGALLLRDGLAKARAGGGVLARGMTRALDGSRRLHDGLTEARAGVAGGLPKIRRLARGLTEGREGMEQLREPVQLAERELRVAMRALEAMLPSSKLDPRYRPAVEALGTALGAISGRHPLTGEPVAGGYDGLDASLAEAGSGLGTAADGVRELHRESRRLHRGLTELSAGGERLSGGLARLDAGAARLLRGIDRLHGGGRRLTDGLARLSTGSRPLADGVTRLREGAGRLAGGLDDGTERIGELTGGVRRLKTGVVLFGRRTNSLTRPLRQSEQLAPAFRSGYVPLAVLDQARPRDRVASSFAINIDRGGSASRVLVIQRDVDISGDPFRDRLDAAAREMAQESGNEVAVGGPAATLQDFNEASLNRLPLLLLVLALVTFVILMLVLRSLIVPLLAVLLNLLTVAATLGVLVLGFQGSAPLGGDGHLDAMMVIAIVAVTFGLAIDYEVFLLARIREGYSLTGDTDEAIAYGLRTTAGVITGAALIMTGVFVAFASSDMLNLRQYGTGLAAGVILDATLVRLVLLPAMIRLAGERAWWLPRWLAPFMPRLEAEAQPDSFERIEAADGAEAVDGANGARRRAPAAV